MNEPDEGWVDTLVGALAIFVVVVIGAGALIWLGLNGL